MAVLNDAGQDDGWQFFDPAGPVLFTFCLFAILVPDSAITDADRNRQKSKDEEQMSKHLSVRQTD
jgi:hypothetical protein